MSSKADRIANISPVQLYADDFCADIAFNHFPQRESSAFDDSAVLPGHDPGYRRRRIRGIGPESADDRRWQVIEGDGAVIGGEVAFVQDEGVTVLEDGDFLDGEGRRRRGSHGVEKEKEACHRCCIGHIHSVAGYRRAGELCVKGW